LGADTDPNPCRGGGRGYELLVLANGEGTTFARWTGSGFTSRFQHHDLGAALSVTALSFVPSLADPGTRSFEFSVASLREDADLAPGRRGVASYPLPPRRSRRARGRPTQTRQLCAERATRCGQPFCFLVTRTFAQAPPLALDHLPKSSGGVQRRVDGEVRR